MTVADVPTGQSGSLPTASADRSEGDRSPDLASLLLTSLAFVLALALVAVAGTFAWHGHTETVEMRLYVLIFLGAVPAAVAAAWLLGARRPTNASLQSVCAVVAVVPVVAGLSIARGASLAGVAVRGGGAGTVLACALLSLALVVAGSLLARRAGPVSAPVARRIRRVAWIVAGAALLVGLVALRPPAMVGAVDLMLIVVLTACLAVVGALVERVGRLRWGGVLVDAAVVVAVVLLGFCVDYRYAVVQPHHDDFYLGTVNDVLHGRAVLVDTVSQYGVGVIYFIAAALSAVPFGYGTFKLLFSLLTVLQLVCAYATLRLSTAGRFASGAVVAAALVVVVPFASVVPSTGPLRFGPPYLLMLLAVWAARRRAAARPDTAALWCAVVVVAVSSLWSLETFTYAFAVAVASLVARAVEQGSEGSSSLSSNVRWFLAGVAGCFTAHIAFAGATRLWSGEWPDWIWYLEYVRLYSLDEFVTLPVVDWSPGLWQPVVYLLSATALVVVAWSRPAWFRSRPMLWTTIATSTAMGVSSYTYFLGRSYDTNHHIVALPALMLLALWAAVPAVASRRGRSATVLATSSVLALILVTHVDVARYQYRHSPAGLVVEGAPPPQLRVFPWAPGYVPGQLRGALSSQLRWMWSSPPQSRGMSDLEHLAALVPDDEPLLVMIGPKVQTEMLIRIDRSNAIRMSHPAQDDLLPDEARERFMPEVDRLADGTYEIRPRGHTELAGVQRSVRDRLDERFDEEVVGAAGAYVLVRIKAAGV